MSSSEHSSQKKETPVQRVPSSTTSESHIPPDKPPSRLQQLLFQPRRIYKTWIRCTIVFGITMILLVDPKTSNAMGQAGFLAAIVAVMLPPTFALSVFFMAVFTVLMGMLIGWAWACAAMASALSVRSPALLAQQEQLLKSMINLNSTIPVETQIEIHTFHGIFLDPRSSAVYGAFLFMGAFGLGVVRAYIPRLGLLSIFGTIIIDVIATIGPLFPTERYMLVKLFLIPTSFYVVVAIASLIFIFPESLNHVWLTSLQNDFIIPTHELLNLLSDSLGTSPSSHEEWQQLTEEGNQIRARLVNGTENLLGQIGLIDLDTSVGRLGPTDLKRVCGELKWFLIRAAGLHAFHTFVNDKNRFDREAAALLAEETKHAAERAQTQNDNPTNQTNASANANAKVNPDAPCYADSRIIDTFHRLRCKIAKRERAHGHDFDSLLPLLASSSLALRDACEEGVVFLSDWVVEVNSHRWWELFSTFFAFGAAKSDREMRKRDQEERRAEMEDMVSRLEARLREFRTDERAKLMKPYEKFFDSETRRMKDGAEGVFTTRSLYIIFVFIDTLDSFTESLLKMLRISLSIDAQRKKVRVWFPGWALLSPTKLKEQVVGQGDTGQGGDYPMSMGTSRDPTAFADDTSRNSSTTHVNTEIPPNTSNNAPNLESYFERTTTRNPDAFPPTSKFAKTYISVCSFFRFLKSAEGIFGMRMGVVSVALWVPSVCTSTAWFYYNHKGLWALIMAQMALAVYAGDQIAGFIVRILGTAIGLAIGIVLWYIGAGRGDGNPYAIVIATTLLLSPFLYLCIAGSPHLVALWVMIPVTGVFIVGFSWSSANLDLIAHPGIGATLGWRRGLLVMIGFAAAFIVMFFPNPLSSRVLVRKTVASIITESGRILAGEIEAFLAEEERARKGIDEKVVFREELDENDERLSMKERRVRRVGKRVIEVSTRLRDIGPSLETAKFEPQLSGVWPRNEYAMLLQLQGRMLSSLVLLISSFEKLDTKHCSILVHQTPYLNPNFIADIFSTLSILASSLSTGSPLPPYLPKLRERLLYHERWSGHEGFQVAGMRRNPVGRHLLEGAGFEDHVEEVLNDLDDVKEPSTPTTTTTGMSEEDAHKLRPEKIDGVTMGLDEITLDTLLDEQLPAYSTAIVAMSAIVFRIDAIAGIVRTLCGEATIPGYVTLLRDYMDWEEKMAGGGSNGVR